MESPGVTPGAEGTRLRIIDAAERLFRTIGYQKTTVADIARDLGMSPANVYRFFSSKSAINEACAERLLAGIADGLWAIARAPRPAPDRLRDLARHLHRQTLALFLTERRMHDMVSAAMAEHWGVVAHYIDEVEGAFRHVLMDGIAEGAFARIDAETASRVIKHALMLWTHPLMLADSLSHGGDEAQLAADLEAAIAFVLRGLGMRDPAETEH